MASLKHRAILSVENIKLALGTLVEHKFRSFLTILGVFIGVLIIVCVASVLNGFRQSFVDQIEEFGTNNIYIYRFPFIQMGRLPRSVRMRRPLKLEDGYAIRDHCPSVASVSVGLEAGRIRTTASYRGESMQGPRLRGVLPDDEKVAHINLEEGRFFSDSENHHRADVCIVGHNVKTALFANETPLNKEINVNGKRLRVIGWAAKRRDGPFGQENQEDSLIRIPYQTFKKYYPAVDDHFIAVEAKMGSLDKAVDEIADTLRRQRGVRWNEDNDFEIGTALSLIESFDKILFATIAVMFVLSSVAFIVGGVGVMNIMLVSVTERTREIGIRKALGARSIDIVQQFLTEAVLLTFLGGALGLAVGEGLVQLAKAVAPSLPAVTPMWGRAFAFLGSVGVGLVFGLWPALKASRLDPIEAMRYE